MNNYKRASKPSTIQPLRFYWPTNYRYTSGKQYLPGPATSDQRIIDTNLTSTQFAIECFFNMTLVKTWFIDMLITSTYITLTVVNFDKLNKQKMNVFIFCWVSFIFIFLLAMILHTFSKLTTCEFIKNIAVNIGIFFVEYQSLSC